MVLAHDFNEGHRTRDVRISQDITFDAMLLTIGTVQGLNESGFHRPSPIQLHGIPLGKCGFGKVFCYIIREINLSKKTNHSCYTSFICKLQLKQFYIIL